MLLNGVFTVQNPGIRVWRLGPVYKPRAGLSPAYGGVMNDAMKTPPETRGLSYAQLKALGPLAPLLKDPRLRDILVQVCHGTGEVWVDVGSGVEQVVSLSPHPEQIATLARAIVSEGGRNLDDLHPSANVRLGDGVRVHALLPPLVAEGAAISIRVPSSGRRSFTELVQRGLTDQHTAQQLVRLVREKQNLLVSGATGSGKTTLLAALLAEVPSNERIISIEDVQELQINHRHHLALEARPPNAEGRGRVTVDDLLVESLRMRPDRIVVGECRGAEVATLMAALNTGHDGGAGTIHASAITDVPARLEALGLLAGLSPEALARQASSAFHAVVHLVRGRHGHRIESLAELHLDQTGALAVRPVFSVATRAVA